jgi:hypothetical protein
MLSCWDVISSWEPRTVSEEAARFTKDVVVCLCPIAPARAKDLLYATSKLAQFAISVGLELDRETLLSPFVIERFARVGMPGASPATRRTLRTNLRFVARCVLLKEIPEPAPLVRQRAKAPYSCDEIQARLAAATHCGGIDRQMRAKGLICLAAGAGLIGRELSYVRGDDVGCRHGGVVVEVGGRKPRVVPVLYEFCAPLLAASRHAGASFVIGGTHPDRKNVTSRISAATQTMHLGHLDTSRLRSYWLAECAKRIGLPNFMAAAGITCSQHLGDIVAFIGPPNDVDTVHLLGMSDLSGTDI